MIVGAGGAGTFGGGEQVFNVAYAGYLITPRLWTSAGGRLTADVVVSRANGGRVSSQYLGLSGAFQTEDAAREAAISHAKAIIDGRLPGLAF